jgi:8-oxo-dGTP pyrophosphatase MutT (NUDIX family)
MPHSAGILIRARDTRRFLFLKGHDGIWSVPGGGVEPGERAKDAAVRELVEETGFHGQLLVSTRAVDLHGYKLYAGEVSREFVPELSDEHVAYQWASTVDPPRPLHPGLDRALREAGA